jgi:hypothetical protein
VILLERVGAADFRFNGLIEPVYPVHRSPFMAAQPIHRDRPHGVSSRAVPRSKGRKRRDAEHAESFSALSAPVMWRVVNPCGQYSLLQPVIQSFSSREKTISSVREAIRWFSGSRITLCAGEHPTMAVNVPTPCSSLSFRKCRGIAIAAGQLGDHLVQGLHLRAERLMQLHQASQDRTDSRLQIRLVPSRQIP